MMKPSFHEDLSRVETSASSTDRAFGLTVGCACAVVGIVLLWFGRTTAWWWLGVGGTLVTVAAARPALLAPLNRAWARFGLLLFYVVNPVVMSILYYLCIVPMGLIMKLFRKDPLKLRPDPTAATYWVPREQPMRPSQSMKDQF